MILFSDKDFQALQELISTVQLINKREGLQAQMNIYACTIDGEAAPRIDIRVQLSGPALQPRKPHQSGQLTPEPWAVEAWPHEWTRENRKRVKTVEVTLIGGQINTEMVTFWKDRLWVMFYRFGVKHPVLQQSDDSAV